MTSAPRTMLDLAALLTRNQLEAALNELEVRDITDKLSIPDLLQRHPRQPGSAKLRALLADVAVRGRFFEADCLWAEQRIIVELDGRAAHGTRRAFERDRERDRLLQSDGWHVIRITWRQLRDDAPAVVADLRRMLRLKGQPPTL